MNTEITAARTLNTVTAEIITIKEQTQKLILDSAIELGRRLCEAKLMTEHGEWGAYLRDEVDFSQSTANNLMRIFEEYGDEQSSLFGASAKSQTFGKLNYSKALALLSVPSEEREDFIENNQVDDMSTRELQKAIKERDAAIKAKEDAEKAEADARKLADERADAIRQAEDSATEAQAEAERIQAEKDELENQLDKLLNAEPVPAAEPDEGVLDAARKEAAAAAKKEAEEKLKKKIAKADEDKKKAEDAKAAAEAERDRIKQQLEQEKTESSERLIAMQKQLTAANSQTMTVFKLHFETAQTALDKMTECIYELDEIEDSEMRGKLSKALRAMCEGVLENVPKIEVSQ